MLKSGLGTVYKYVSFERKDILEKNRIRFTQPGVLNDPFETLPSSMVRTFLSTNL